MGRGGGPARAVAVAARDAGARVVAAGRHPHDLAAAYADEPGITVDLDDESMITRNPARRIGTADDIASAVLFALANAFFTGVTLAVDGGEVLT